MSVIPEIEPREPMTRRRPEGERSGRSPRANRRLTSTPQHTSTHGLVETGDSEDRREAPFSPRPPTKERGEPRPTPRGTTEPPQHGYQRHGQLDRLAYYPQPDPSLEHDVQPTVVRRHGEVDPLQSDRPHPPTAPSTDKREARRRKNPFLASMLAVSQSDATAASEVVLGRGMGSSRGGNTELQPSPPKKAAPKRSGRPRKSASEQSFSMHDLSGREVTDDAPISGPPGLTVFANSPTEEFKAALTEGAAAWGYKETVAFWKKTLSSDQWTDVQREMFRWLKEQPILMEGSTLLASSDSRRVALVPLTPKKFKSRSASASFFTHFAGVAHTMATSDEASERVAGFLAGRDAPVQLLDEVVEAFESLGLRETRLGYGSNSAPLTNDGLFVSKTQEAATKASDWTGDVLVDASDAVGLELSEEQQDALREGVSSVGENVAAGMVGGRAGAMASSAGAMLDPLSDVVDTAMGGLNVSDATRDRVNEVMDTSSEATSAVQGDIALLAMDYSRLKETWNHLSAAWKGDPSEKDANVRMRHLLAGLEGLGQLTGKTFKIAMKIKGVVESGAVSQSASSAAVGPVAIAAGGLHFLNGLVQVAASHQDVGRIDELLAGDSLDEGGRTITKRQREQRATRRTAGGLKATQGAVMIGAGVAGIVLASNPIGIGVMAGLALTQAILLYAQKKTEEDHQKKVVKEELFENEKGYKTSLDEWKKGEAEFRAARQKARPNDRRRDRATAKTMDLINGSDGLFLDFSAQQRGAANWKQFYNMVMRARAAQLFGDLFSDDPKVKTGAQTVVSKTLGLDAAGCRKDDGSGKPNFAFVDQIAAKLTL